MENRSYESRECRPHYVVLMKYRLRTTLLFFVQLFEAVM